MADGWFRTNPKGAVLPSLSLALLIVFLLFLCINASAQVTSLDSLHAQEAGIKSIKSLDMTIENDGLISFSEELVVRRGDIVRRIIPGRVDNLEVLDSKGNNIPIYESSPKDEKQLLGFYLENANQTDEEIWIRYTSLNISARINGARNIRYSNFFTAKNTIIKLHFPDEAQIVQLEPTDVFRTNIKPNELWLFPQEDYMNFSCTYTLKGDVINVPAQTKQSSNLSLIWIILLAYVVVFTLLMFMKRAKKKPNQ